MYNTFPVFARWALRKKNTDAAPVAETAVPIQALTAETDSATQIGQADQSKLHSRKEKIENSGIAGQRGARASKRLE